MVLWNSLSLLACLIFHGTYHILFIHLLWLNINSPSILLVTQLCPILCDPIGWSPLGSSVMEFSRQEYWSRLPFPLPGDLPKSGIKPRSLALQADSGKYTSVNEFSHIWNSGTFFFLGQTTSKSIFICVPQISADIN